MALINSSHKPCGRLAWQRTLDIFTRYFYISQMTTDHAVTNEPAVSCVVDSVGHRWLAPVRAVHSYRRRHSVMKTALQYTNQCETLHLPAPVKSDQPSPWHWETPWSLNRTSSKYAKQYTSQQELSSCWDGRPCGPKSGRGLLCPFQWHPPSNTMSPWLRPTSLLSARHLHPSNGLAQKLRK